MSNLISTEQQFFLYRDDKGKVQVNALLQDENIWLTQKAMAELFEVDRSVINKHVNNIYKEAELREEATCAKIAQVQTEGKREVSREVDFYNLDMIIAVGYRVNSKRATAFRIWATQVLKEYIIKGFALDDERLKNGTKFGKDYFQELLEVIREIRASERRFYQKITDIYKECSIDYDPDAEITRDFYAKVQNKLHYAITGHTAPEIIFERADCNKPHMGLKTWKKSPGGKILKSDVVVAKNYLDEEEIKTLNLAVSAYLDIAEMQARNQVAMTMKDWVEKLDAFLSMTGYKILENAGKIKTEVAHEKAEHEYEKFREIQDKDYISDFDKQVKKLTGKK